MVNMLMTTFYDFTRSVTGQCVCPVGTVCAASDIGYEHMLREFMEGGPSSLSAVPVAGKRHH